MNQFPLLLLAVSLTASLASSQEIRPLDWSKIEGGASDDELANLCVTVLEHTQKDMGRDWLEKVADTPDVDGLLDFARTDGHSKANRPEEMPSRSPSCCVV